jgi:hypothetical protein
MYRGRQRERRARGRIGCESLREKESGGRGSREGLREGERHPFSNKAATLHTFASDQAEFSSSSKKKRKRIYREWRGEGEGERGFKPDGVLLVRDDFQSILDDHLPGQRRSMI